MILVENLQFLEEQAKLQKMQSEEALKQPVVGGKAPGKPDPKKDPKAAMAQKKGAVVEDKNAPKQITVDYPENTPYGPNYAIFEKAFTQMRDQLIKGTDAAT